MEDTIYLVPDDPEDAERWEETGTRRRILDGEWAEDLARYLMLALNVRRASNIGRVSRGINLAKSVCSQVGPPLYDSPPTVDAPSDDPTVTEALDEMFDESSVWQMAQRHAGYVVGLRESLYAIEWSRDRGVTLRLVTPDRVVVEAPTSDPYDIRTVKEARSRMVRTREGVRRVSYWNVWTLRDGGRHYLEDSSGADVTVEVLGEEGAAAIAEYPYVSGSGEPYLPFVLYHAAPTGRLWDPEEWCELFDGTFDVATLWNNWAKVMRDASWAQKYGIDLDLAGVSHREEGGATVGRVTTSPDSILMFRSTSDRGGSLGTLEPPVDVEKYADAVLRYQQTVVSTVGVSPADIERQTGTPESGYAIQLKRSAQRRMALAMEPQFRRGDLELVSKMAMTRNLFAGDGVVLPEDGYRITYHPVGDSVADRVAHLDYTSKLVEAGLLDRVEQYRMEHPDSSEAEAVAAVLRSAAVQAAMTDPGRLLAAGARTVDDMIRLAAGREIGMDSETDNETDNRDEE